MNNFGSSDQLIDGQVLYHKGDRVDIGGLPYEAKHDITVGEFKRIDVTNAASVISCLSPIKS
jgi:hypothetical protein